mgnify:CR=1 FL=1
MIRPVADDEDQGGVYLIDGALVVAIPDRAYRRRRSKPRRARRYDRRMARMERAGLLAPRPPVETPGQRAEREALAEVRALAASLP